MKYKSLDLLVGASLVVLGLSSQQYINMHQHYATNVNEVYVHTTVYDFMRWEEFIAASSACVGAYILGKRKNDE